MEITCKVDGCEREVTRRKWGECESHYYRRTTYGNYNEQRRTQSNATWDERLTEDKWVVSAGPLETDCWIWQESLNADGYGIIKYHQKTYRVYRVMWERLHGREIPKGKSALHRCDTPACMNPHHIFIGTQIDNIRDMVSKGRQRSRRGLTDDEVRSIRAMIRGGMKQAEVIRLMGLESSTVSRIVNRKLYKEIE